MAIPGYYQLGFHHLPAPYVEAGVEFPRLGLGATITFLIDTGADNTSLHPADIARFPISYRRLRRSTSVYPNGIGGSMGYFQELAILYFRDTSGPLRRFGCAIHICQRTTEKGVEGLPSILGRDFLNLCSSSMDKATNSVLMDPIHLQGDWVLPSPP